MMTPFDFRIENRARRSHRAADWKKSENPHLLAAFGSR
jgi:hypothetical protein